MDVTHAETLLADLEGHPDRVQLHHGGFEQLIQECMGEVYELAKTGDDDACKMRLVAIEHRARLVSERWRKLSMN